MTQKNSLMEWLEQTKKLSKSLDYTWLSLVDNIFEALPFVRRDTLTPYGQLINDVCKHYHKPNPFDADKLGSVKIKNECTTAINMLIAGSLKRCEEKEIELIWQYHEIVDFMYEYPNMVDPRMIDARTRGMINYVCNRHRKNNPFKDGTHKLFGKYWRDEKGKLIRERRHFTNGDDKIYEEYWKNNQGKIIPERRKKF